MDEEYPIMVIDHRSGECASGLPGRPWVDMIRSIKDRIRVYVGWYGIDEPLEIEIICPSKPQIKEYLEIYASRKYERHQSKLGRNA